MSICSCKNLPYYRGVENVLAMLMREGGTSFDVVLMQDP